MIKLDEVRCSEVTAEKVTDRICTVDFMKKHLKCMESKEISAQVSSVSEVP